MTRRGIVTVVVALALGFLGGWMAQRLRGPGLDLSAAYHAVLLVNGQAYFGKIDKLNRNYMVLSDVHYIQSQVNPQTKEAANTLVKRGKEWHAPVQTILNREHVLLIEPVGKDSQVAKLIDELKKKSP